MIAVLLFLTALVPVLCIGTVLVELLLQEAPRRGKRPDIRGNSLPPRFLVRIITADGRIVSGTPRQVVRRLQQENGRYHFLFSELIASFCPGWMLRQEIRRSNVLLQTQWSAGE